MTTKIIEDCGFLGLFPKELERDDIKHLDEVGKYHSVCGPLGLDILWAKRATEKDVPDKWHLPCGNPDEPHVKVQGGKCETFCSNNEYELKPATYISERECEPLRVCNDDEFESAAPTKTTDRTCTSLTTCLDTEYEKTSPTKYADRECVQHSKCKENEFMAKKGTATSDSQCNTVTTCESNEFESLAPTNFNDRQCTVYSNCDGANKRVKKEGTATTDRECGCVPEWTGPECKDNYNSTIDFATEACQTYYDKKAKDCADTGNKKMNCSTIRFRTTSECRQFFDDKIKEPYECSTRWCSSGLKRMFDSKNECETRTASECERAGMSYTQDQTVNGWVSKTIPGYHTLQAMPSVGELSGKEFFNQNKEKFAFNECQIAPMFKNESDCLSAMSSVNESLPSTSQFTSCKRITGSSWSMVVDDVCDRPFVESVINSLSSSITF
jgi:hypothetical protein